MTRVSQHTPRYEDGEEIRKGDAVLRSGTVPARIIDVFEADPPSVWLEDAERPGKSFVTVELDDLTLVERATADFAGAGAEWLRRRGEEGDAQALAALGWLHESGVAVARDDARAVALYRRAAECGNAVAQFNIALRYEKGRGVDVDLAQAVRWYRASAEQGTGPAMKNLSNLYRDGRGTPQDLQQAVRWLRAAEAAGCG
jgi:TPR repeat protein